jgi:hopene-associated glycosyltransferase HpnB
MIGMIIWTLLALNILRQIHALRSLKPVDGPLPENLPPIDLIVPARNEESVFESSMVSLLGQDYPNFRVVAIDDQSTDSTLAIMEGMAVADPRLRVVKGVERPPGWVGKTWAVHQGYSKSQSEWIGFIDADMNLHPRALATAMIVAARESADMVSLMPRVDCRTFWQGAVAVSFLQFLVHLYPISRVNNLRSKAAIAAGGFILVRRSAYEKAGGHEAGRHDIVDDIQLARRIKSHGGRLYVRLAPDLATTHMYGTFRQIWVGLRKNAYAGMDYQFHKYLFGMAGAVYLAWAPIIILARAYLEGSGSRAVIGALCWLAQAAATIPIVIFLRLRPWYAFTVPAGMAAYAAIASSSVWHHHRGRILWKGRTLDSAAVRADQELKNL